MSEKSEKPTPYKLQKAKEKGQINKSNDLINCLFLMVLLGIITVFWPQYLLDLRILFSKLLQSAGQIRFNLHQLSLLNQYIFSFLLNMWLPLAIAGVLTIILATIGQTGMVWTVTPLTPDFKRLSIAQGFKKIFSYKSLFQGGKSIISLSLLFLFLYFIVLQQLPAFMNLTLINPQQHPDFIMHFILKLMLEFTLLLSALSLMDKAFTRWKFYKDQRMSKQEIKDEYKQKEGDPQIKSKIKKLHAQLRQQTASLKLIKTADVIVAYTPYLAVALKYERFVMPAPKVISKAHGDLILEIRTLAQQQNIPWVENKEFAQALYEQVPLNQWIHKEHFSNAAVIFKDIFNQRIDNEPEVKLI